MREQRWPNYYRAVARSVGVPEFWIDDAGQDIALATWRDGKQHDPTAIRREAIDAARRYGPYSRRKVLRPQSIPLEAVADMPHETPDALELRDAMSSAFGELTPKQRLALRRRLQRLPMSSLDSAHASAARRKLRRELGGY